MIKVPLANGKHAQIDDEDIELVRKYSWFVFVQKNISTQQYVLTKVKLPSGKLQTMSMHTLIMGSRPGHIIDHRDGDGLNNQKSNLRFATNSQNNANAKRHGNGSSSYKGLYWDKQKNRWTVRITVNKKRIHLGTYIDEIDAAKAYDKAALSYYGEYAKLNFEEANLE